MKTYILSIIFMIFLANNYLFAQGNNLVVYNECGQKFTLALNGKKISEAGNTYFKVVDLKEDRYLLHLDFANEKLKPIDKEVVFKNKGEQYSYYLSYVKGKFRLSKPILGPLTDSIPGQPSPFPFHNGTNK